MSVDIIYNQLKWKETPMGIHSVDKNIRWWKKVIPEFGNKDVKVEILDVQETVKKDEAKELFKYL